MLKIDTLRLKKLTETLVDDIGYDVATKVTGSSIGVLARNYSTLAMNKSRFICVDGVAALEAHASYPFVTSELAKMNGFDLRFAALAPAHAQSCNADDIILDISARFSELVLELRCFRGKNDTKDQQAKLLGIKIAKLEQSLIELKVVLCKRV